MPTTLFEPPTATWKVGNRNPDQEENLVRHLGLSSVTAAVLVQRGFTEPDVASAFLNPSLDSLGNPSDLPDFEAAAKVILSAKESRDLIFIHGDYDVDGVTSAAILHRFLSRIGCNIHTHVPHRQREGYGIHLEAVDRAHEMGAKLFLTCDCGIAAHEQVRKARSFGMKVVVTDHHEIADSIPEAEAVINPHREDSRYPEKELSGAGVVFRLCEGLTRELNHPVGAYRRAFIDLACLGTIADVMPLLGENRTIAKFGLEQLNRTNKVGLQALMKEANVGQDPCKPVRAFNVGWHLGPRLNAVGRIEDAANALRLLIEYDGAAAALLAEQLEAVNTDRRERTSTTVEQAIEMVLERGYHKHSMIVVAHPDWHPGIVGIVAGRLVEKFCRPALVLNIDESTGACRGSARSIPRFHLAEAIWAFPHLLKGGGHAMAAGCSFSLDDLEEVRNSLNGFAEARLDPADLTPSVWADFCVQSDELTPQSLRELSMLEPFGCANPEPTFCAEGMTLKQATPTRNPAHAQLTLADSAGRSHCGIAFHIGESLAAVPAGSIVDVLFRPELNEFRGQQRVQWQVKHFRTANS